MLVFGIAKLFPHFLIRKMPKALVASPSNGLKRKKSVAEALDTPHKDEADEAPVKSRKKAKKDKESREEEVQPPVEGKKKHNDETDEASVKSREKAKKDKESRKEEVQPVEGKKKRDDETDEASVKSGKKAKKDKESREEEVQPPVEGKKKKHSKTAPDAGPVEQVSHDPAPSQTPITLGEEEPEVVAKRSKKSKKSKAESAPEPIPVNDTEEVVAQPPKKSKRSKPIPVPEPEPMLADEAADSDSDEDAPLHGFSTDDDDSSDDDGYMNVEVSAFDVAKLPTIAKDDATVKRKLENAKRQPASDRGVLFLGRIPHGFYEEQLKAYFAQFGNVTRLRVSRNKKTGQSKHYGFIEFDSSSVAQIVADTMDNYLLMGHIMRCKVIPKDQVHPELWVGANRRWRPVPTVRVAQAEHNKVGPSVHEPSNELIIVLFLQLRTKDEQMRADHRLLRRQEERRRKLDKAGIKYDFGDAGYKLAKVIEV
ncbi:hypothetical protein B0H12DRAFT_403027 [Mycena haematopus]|nr:hypothetical protein B0H12DRAFT_403027 [Mycena haematopus]